MGFFRSFPKKRNAWDLVFHTTQKSTEKQHLKQFLEMLGIYFVPGWSPRKAEEGEWQFGKTAN